MPQGHPRRSVYCAGQGGLPGRRPLPGYAGRGDFRSILGHRARLAAGAGLSLADELMAGTIRNGFALLRPPGHHAEKSQALGFCLFNNIAILARYLQRRHGLEKILILDWDVHHGNGTQHAFEEDPSVFYISLHQFPFYPGTGAGHEKGSGRGKGYTLNCPMPAGAWDGDYRTAFENVILPRAREYRPDAVLISAGFDAHFSDPLAQVQLSTEMYGWMTREIMAVAQEFSGGRVLSLLEGGYDLEYLPRCIEAHVAVLAGHS
jgi:acetoin utilization deacetylase AcuC-like enzyme